MESSRDKKTSWSTTLGAIALVLLASATFLSTRVAPPSSVMLSADDECMQGDEITIYKYTIASSKSVEDAQWAGEMLGCSFRDVTDTKGCADLGKTTCLPESLAYNLHFVANKVTQAGDKDIAYWDDYTTKLHGKMDHFNAFMDYRMVFYAKELDFTLSKALDADADIMLRKTDPDENSVEWYSLLLKSPSGKIFEVTSTRLNYKKMSDHPKGKAYLASQGGSLKTWTDEQGGACAHTQSPKTYLGYTVDELDAWVETLNQKSGSSKGAEYPLPIRNQIAVSSLSRTKGWWAEMFPSIEQSTSELNTDACQSMSMALESYTTEGFKIETRFVQNDQGAVGDKSVRDFIGYIEEQHKAYTEPNKGWDAWYDRHLGIMCNKCALDKYMTKFFKNDVSFMPHGRDELTENTGTPTQHCWTEGVEGYGLEMQGAFDFSFRSCYTVFDWCTEDTVGAQFCSAESTDATSEESTEATSEETTGIVRNRLRS